MYTVNGPHRNDMRYSAAIYLERWDNDEFVENHTHQLSVTPGKPVSEYRAGWIFEYGRRRALSSIMSAANKTHWQPQLIKCNSSDLYVNTWRRLINSR